MAGKACPLDKTALVPRWNFGIQGHSCLQCQGCWMPHDSVRQAFAKLPGSDARWDRFFERVKREGRKAAVSCASCASALLATTFREVEVDVCPDCQGMWFDGGELRRFLPSQEGKGVSPGLVVGVAGAAALGAAGAAAAAELEAKKNARKGESPLAAIFDVSAPGASMTNVAATNDAATDVGSEIVGGVFSFIGEMLSD